MTVPVPATVRRRTTMASHSRCTTTILARVLRKRYTVTVQNVAPTVTLIPVDGDHENGIATVTGSYTDIGRLDGHVLTIDWGDPNDAGDSTFTIPSILDAAGAADASDRRYVHFVDRRGCAHDHLNQCRDRRSWLQRFAPVFGRRPRARQQHGQRCEHDRRDGNGRRHRERQRQ